MHIVLHTLLGASRHTSSALRSPRDASWLPKQGTRMVSLSASGRGRLGLRKIRGHSVGIAEHYLSTAPPPHRQLTSVRPSSPGGEDGPHILVPSTGTRAEVICATSGPRPSCVLPWLPSPCHGLKGGEKERITLEATVKRPPGRRGCHGREKLTSRTSLSF